MLASFWFSFLYQPVFNVLIWIYVNIAEQNLGWAVVWLTVFLRIFLLPLTIKSERDAKKRVKAEQAAWQTAKEFKSDPIAQKEEIRRIMKKNRISPWAQVVSLSVQLLMLVLLYQVFIGGIEGRKVINTLYDGIDYPGKLNTDFYGFDIGARYDYIWAGVVFIYLFIYIFLSNRQKKWNAAKATFLFLFPASVWLALFILPMVKSIFILTSMLFSDIISLLMMPFFPKEPKEEQH